MITTAEVWGAIPKRARIALADNALAVDSDWTVERLAKTPWSLLPPEIKYRIHLETTCQEME